MSDFVVKDSGERIVYASGMRRDVVDDKPDFMLIMESDLPFDDRMLTRFAMHMAKGAIKYGPKNWEKSDSEEELERFLSSAMRHMMQWLAGDRSEDHASAIYFNVMAAERLRRKLGLDRPQSS